MSKFRLLYVYCPKHAEKGRSGKFVTLGGACKTCPFYFGMIEGPALKCAYSKTV